MKHELLKLRPTARRFRQRATVEHEAPRSHISLKEEKLATGT